MNSELSPNAQAILLLTAPLLTGRSRPSVPYPEGATGSTGIRRLSKWGNPPCSMSAATDPPLSYSAGNPTQCSPHVVDASAMQPLCTRVKACVTCSSLLTCDDVRRVA